ncbi:HNH endonuclease [Streptomyces sp. or20]|uniref:HNH endonuclease n=1 Tax=Streptomyces sp. or20 TaxID=1828016 RepID=UPI000BEFFDD9|nr:HNH endonuclease [Streptomyces sp. or20]
MESPLADKKARMRFNKAMREKGVPAKACGKCFVVKGHEAFSSDRNKAGGRSSRCRQCAAEVSCKWYTDNSGRRAEYRHTHAKKIADTNLLWREANRERKLATTRAWRSSHPDKTRLYNHTRRARIAAATVVPFTYAEMLADWEEHDLYGCAFCGGPYEDIEHLVPISKGGEHSIANIVPSCVECNRGVGGKASRLPWEWLSERYPELAPILVPSVLPDVE